jgi:hypothetical protein
MSNLNGDIERDKIAKDCKENEKKLYILPRLHRKLN